MAADGRARQTPLPGWRRGWAWLGGLSLALAVLHGLGGPVTLGLRYERSALAAGEFWRVLTAHLVHANLNHLVLNLAGLGLLALLFPKEYSPRGWFLIGVVSACTVATGLWWLNPDLSWYVGLSGVLHGALAAGALAWWSSQPRWLAATLTGVLLAKLGWEQAFGAMGLVPGVTVVVDAHLYGASGGLVAALFVQRMRFVTKP